ARRARPHPPATRSAAPWRRGGFAGSRASRRPWDSHRSRWCRGRCAGRAPRSKPTSRMRQKSSGETGVLTGADATDMMVMPGLRRTCIVLVTDDMRPVFAELAIYCWLPAAKLCDAVAKGVEHTFVVA